MTPNIWPKEQDSHLQIRRKCGDKQVWGRKPSLALDIKFKMSITQPTRDFKWISTLKFGEVETGNKCESRIQRQNLMKALSYDFQLYLSNIVPRG